MMQVASHAESTSYTTVRTIACLTLVTQQATRPYHLFWSCEKPQCLLVVHSSSDSQAERKRMAQQKQRECVFDGGDGADFCVLVDGAYARVNRGLLSESPVLGHALATLPEGINEILLDGTKCGGRRGLHHLCTYLYSTSPSQWKWTIPDADVFHALAAAKEFEVDAMLCATIEILQQRLQSGDLDSSFRRTLADQLPTVLVTLFDDKDCFTVRQLWTLQKAVCVAWWHDLN
jgi:hypothetical protein